MKKMLSPRIAAVAIASLGGLLAPQIGCGGKSTIAAPPVRPVVTAFSVADSSLIAGDSTTLTATFTGGTGVISPNVGTVTSGSTISVSPTATTTFTLTVTNAAGLSVVSSVNVVVGHRVTYAGELETMTDHLTIGVEAPYASGWTRPATIALATNEPVDQVGSDAKSYGSWDHIGEETITYSFSSDVTANHSAVYWRCDGEGTLADNNGGLNAPSSYKVQYWNSATAAWVDVPNPHSETTTDNGTTWSPDTVNPPYYETLGSYDYVAFDNVTTSKLRLLMQPRAQSGSNGSTDPRSIGLQRWKLWGSATVVVSGLVSNPTSK